MIEALFAKIFKSVGTLSPSGSECLILYLDEPKMPRSMINK